MEKEKLASLLAGSKENKALAQERLYKEFFLLMVRHVKKLVKDEHEALSIVNDGFLKAFTYLDSFSFYQGSFQAWLRKVMTNTALDHLKKQKRNIQFAELDESLALTDNSHLTAPSLDGLDAWVKKLPSLSRSVFSLSMEGYSHREISQILQISELSSRWHLSQAKKKIRQYIN